MRRHATGIIGVDEKAEQEHFIAPESPHALELLGELETAIRELVAENKERDREITELKQAGSPRRHLRPL